jgi:hypothetical protein
LLLFDATLASYKVVIDSTPGATNSYGRIAAPLIPYMGDSTIFTDYSSQSLLIIDQTGKVVRVTAPPKPQDLNWLISGNPATDAVGRLVYRSTASRVAIPSAAALNGRGATSSAPPIDSAPIMRADWDTGVADTLAKVKIQTGSSSTTKLAPDGTRSFTMRMNPLSWADDWAMNSDGMIAIVRGQDYHIDWIAPDGKKSSSPKMPYDWRHLTDQDKQAIIDSVRHIQDSVAAIPGNGPRMTSTINGVTTTTVMKIVYEYATPSEMPDYYPPIRTGSVLADRDGNIWILPYTSAKGDRKGLLYDVVDKKGELTERVQLPEGRSIAGFGREGIIYMMFPAPLAKPGDRPGSAGFYLERTTVDMGSASPVKQ